LKARKKAALFEKSAQELFLNGTALVAPSSGHQNRHCEERSDEAIQSFSPGSRKKTGLLPPAFAEVRNDGVGGQAPAHITF
jgi:hypothetical protein